MTFFDQDSDPDLPEDIEPLEMNSDHDPKTCPNCMKIVLCDALDALENQSLVSLVIASDKGAYSLTSDDWAKNFEFMRGFINVAEDAIAAVLVGTPFPFEKYERPEPEAHDA